MGSLSIHFQSNTGGLQRALKAQQTQEQGQQWQATFQNAANVQKGRQKRKPQTQKTSKTHKTSASSAVALRPIYDQENPTDEGEIGVDRSHFFHNYEDAEAYNMQEDLKLFVRPPHIDNDALAKDKLWEVSNEILVELDQSDATPALKKRAAYLLQE